MKEGGKEGKWEISVTLSTIKIYLKRKKKEHYQNVCIPTQGMAPASKDRFLKFISHLLKDKFVHDYVLNQLQFLWFHMRCMY